MSYDQLRRKIKMRKVTRNNNHTFQMHLQIPSKNSLSYLGPVWYMGFAWILDLINANHVFGCVYGV